MNNLRNNTITTLEVAEMMEVPHSDLLQKRMVAFHFLFQVNISNMFLIRSRKWTDVQIA